MELPARKDGIPESEDIYPTEARPAPKPEVVEAVSVAAEKVAGITVPDGIYDLHQRVRAWLAEHKADQKERAHEAKRHGPNSWYARSPLKDLTEHDLYRFRVTSAIFTGVEKAGGRIESARIVGKIVFLIAGYQVECMIVEKMVKSLKQRNDQRDWTAFSDFQKPGLESSG